MDKSTSRAPNVTVARKSPRDLSFEYNIPDLYALMESMYRPRTTIPNVEPDYGNASMPAMSPLRGVLNRGNAVGMVGNPETFIPSLYQSALRFYGGIRR